MQATGERLFDELRQRFAVVATAVELAGRRWELFHPRNPDDLIDEAAFERDERLPYWADVWASAVGLAERIAVENGAGRRLLELGCGIGLPSLVAAAGGFAVTATDYYAEALDFTRLNFQSNHQPAPTTRLVDWRRLPDDLGRFDVVAAADVLYERPYCDLVAATFARTLSPNGRGLLVDPSRQHAARFPDQCAAHGLTLKRREKLPVLLRGKSQIVDLYELALNPS
jgi:predicted nicotinamide N-methyase